MRTPLALLLAALVAACTSPRPGPLPGGASLERWPPEVRAAIREKRLLRGMDAEAVRLAWGEPDAVERTPSASAPGLEYQRWSWRAGSGGPARFAWLAGGQVIDFLAPPAGGPAATAPPR